MCKRACAAADLTLDEVEVLEATDTVLSMVLELTL